MKKQISTIPIRLIYFYSNVTIEQFINQETREKTIREKTPKGYKYIGYHPKTLGIGLQSKVVLEFEKIERKLKEKKESNNI